MSMNILIRNAQVIVIIVQTKFVMGVNKVTIYQIINAFFALMDVAIVVVMKIVFNVNMAFI